MGNDKGIAYCIDFTFLFVFLTIFLQPYFSGTQWCFINSIMRLLLGIFELWIFIKIYSKKKWTNVINLRYFKEGLAAGAGIVILIVFFIVYFAVGVKVFIRTTFPVVFSDLFLLQITTGFYEELTFRAFPIEGYFFRENKTWITRLAYASFCFVIFGLLHIIGCDTLLHAVYRFMITGAVGFIFASVYLHSHNILVPMILHFVYDIFANGIKFVAEWNESAFLTVMKNYIFYALMAISFIIALIYLIRGTCETDSDTVVKSCA